MSNHGQLLTKRRLITKAKQRFLSERCSNMAARIEIDLRPHTDISRRGLFARVSQSFIRHLMFFWTHIPFLVTETQFMAIMSHYRLHLQKPRVSAERYVIQGATTLWEEHKQPERVKTKDTRNMFVNVSFVVHL